jgi:NiFe hydrogenase small subunit HydA
MSLSLYWLSCGGCGGDSMSLLNAASPNIIELKDTFNIKVLWHPSFATGSASDHRRLTAGILDGSEPLDILCLEGTILRGPGGTGRYDMVMGQPKKDWVAKLAAKAKYVIAVGTCASFGGMGATGQVEGTGVQFLHWKQGGFLGQSFKSGSGLPVINLPGCPCHPEVFSGIIMAIALGKRIELNRFQEPLEWFGMLVHQGCTRNEYHEYRVEEEGFGERGCLFFHLGCHGPLAYGPCNKLLWNQRSSKTRVGVPCFGCTRPDFPQSYPFFQTRNIEGIPLELPNGIDRAHYMAYKGLAAAAAPQRLKKRKTKV